MYGKEFVVPLSRTIFVLVFFLRIIVRVHFITAFILYFVIKCDSCYTRGGEGGLFVFQQIATHIAKRVTPFLC